MVQPSIGVNCGPALSQLWKLERKLETCACSASPVNSPVAISNGFGSLAKILMATVHACTHASVSNLRLVSESARANQDEVHAGKHTLWLSHTRHLQELDKACPSRILSAHAALASAGRK